MTGPLLWTHDHPGPPEFVLHPSVALAWWPIYRGTVYAQRVFRRVTSTVAIVPATFGVQIADAVRRVERAGAATRVQVETYYAGLRAFWIRADGEANARAWSDTHGLARTRRVSVYDAAYLELARRLNLPLAAEDPTLTRHAAAAGVPIFSP
ncbi:MAG: type II toxin-antitoxin system VapC family toxin [Gemmataceae bacterium]|nr:type II toxin-antitoxin system VapC family toxin [Gemmataceae bacterium]